MSLFAPLSAALVTFFLTHILLSNKIAKRFHDVPNERSLHGVPVPRMGGTCLLAGIVSGWVWQCNDLVWWLVVPMIVLYAVSLFDDMRNVSVKMRLLAHAVAAILLIAGSEIYGQQGILIAVVLMMSTVWMTNLYNFMDGSDGLACGMALFGFGTYSIAAWLDHNQSLAALNLTIAAASASILYFNFHPAKIFLGDAGSIPLGFLVAAMGLIGWQQGSWEPWFPVLVFSPFIIDASVTLIKRTLRGVKVTEAHREHYYQRLIRLGWSHKGLALAAYVVMFAACASALWTQQHGLTWQIPAIWCAVYAVLMWRVDIRWKTFMRSDNA